MSLVVLLTFVSGTAIKQFNGICNVMLGREHDSKNSQNDVVIGKSNTDLNGKNTIIVGEEQQGSTLENTLMAGKQNIASGTWVLLYWDKVVLQQITTIHLLLV